MTRWRRVEAVFSEAADLAPAARPAFLDAACRTDDGRPDAALREEVEALLAADVVADGFFDSAEVRLGDAARAAVAQSEAVPDVVGPWRLVEEVGRGGMGTVYRAERADGDGAGSAMAAPVEAGADVEA